jgi:hypothetical protein
MVDISDDLEQQRQLLQTAKVIAVVGFSDKPDRDSYQVGRYLQAAGYTVYPINPAVERIGDDKSYASLADVPEPIDIVDVFRKAEALPAIIDEAIAVGAQAVWGQLTVTHPGAAAKAAGLTLVMDRCIKVQHGLLIVGA